MAKGYWINQSDITDEAGHAVYAKAVAEYLARRGAKTLVLPQAGRRQVVEGSPRSRQLIREFHALGLCRALDEKRQPGPSACSPAPRQGLRQAEQPGAEEQLMPAPPVLFEPVPLGDGAPK